MHMFTALFDTRADAEAVQQTLKSLGIVDLDEVGVHDQDAPGFDARKYSAREDAGLWGAPRMLFPPDEDRHLHEEHLRRGGFLLTVSVDDEEATRVHDVLEHSGAVDVEERERDYKGSGFTPPAAPLGRTAEAVQGEQVIPIFDERLQVGKRAVERGGVKVRAYVVDTPVREEVTLREEHVGIERRPVDKRIDRDPSLFIERTLEATERSEEVVVGKEARVVEEVSVRKNVGERTETIRDTVRHTEVDVERLGGVTPHDTREER